MRLRRASGWLVIPVLLLGCTQLPIPTPGPVDPPAVEGPPTRPLPSEQPENASFHLFASPLGFKYEGAMERFAPGDLAVAGVEPFDLDLIFPGLSEDQLRGWLVVEGADLLASPVWLPEGGLALQISEGEPEQLVTVRLERQGEKPVSLTIRRVGPASVTIDQRFGHGWRPVTVLDAYTSPGPSAVRFNFSKPVQQEEVERALLAAQSQPLRGLMEWSDSQTLTWQIAELPPRLDFLLGGAHDLDGLPLPGGIPSLRLGEPPVLVEVNLDSESRSEVSLGLLPPDLISATLTTDGQAVNLLAWMPGTTKWDWESTSFRLEMASGTLKPGRHEESLPRLSPGIDSWVVSPGGSLVAGLKSNEAYTESYRADLVVMEMRGGRGQSFPGVIGRFRGVGQLDLTTHLVWSPDSRQVAALSYAGEEERADLVVIDLVTGQSQVVMSGLSVRSDGTRLAWSADGRWMVAGRLLIDLETKETRQLPGGSQQAMGAWEPGGQRLLYSAYDWGGILLIDPQGEEPESLGEGMVVGWRAPGRALVIRWPSSETRYLPPGVSVGGPVGPTRSVPELVAEGR